MEDKNGGIPGLDLDHAIDEGKKCAGKKVPYSKPIPRNFQAQWNEMEGEDLEQVEALNAFVNQLIETTPGAVPLTEVKPNAIILFGKMITVERKLFFRHFKCTNVKKTQVSNKISFFQLGQSCQKP